jgi:hypothetical protein
MVVKGLARAFLAVCVVTAPADGSAAKKSSKKKSSSSRGTIVDAADVFSVQVTVKEGKTAKTKAVSCFKSTPGETKSTKRGLLFTSYATLVKKMKGSKKYAKKLIVTKKLQKAGQKACKRSPANPANTPDFLSLEPYPGPFGEDEARILFDRFGFGARPDEVQWGVAQGLNGLVTALTTYVPEPSLDSYEADLQCDGRIAGVDEKNELCNPNDRNDLYMPGVRYGVYGKFWYSQNPFFEKFWMWLHDERLAVSSSALGWNEAYALPEYVGILRRAARSGDYMQYMRDLNKDLFTHLEWLDGASNRGDSPNENYAREFWELGTVGATGLDGAPVYGDFDIAQSALAFSGWTLRDDRINNFWVRMSAFVPALHAPGAKSIFLNSPYQSTVYNDEDVLQATFRHPRTAEHLAEDLWKEFINPYATPDAIRALAAHIRDSNYNLLPVFRTIMKSKAVFAAGSRKSLVKHPVELMFGLLRQTGIPVSYWFIDSTLEDMGQRPLLAETVFGWNERQLAGEGRVLDWRNAVLSLVSQSSNDLEKKGFVFGERFLEGLATADAPSREMVLRTAARLNIQLNESQIGSLVQYLDYQMRECWDRSRCNGQQYVVERDIFDPHPDADEYKDGYKTRGLIAILASLPEYRLK